MYFMYQLNRLNACQEAMKNGIEEKMNTGQDKLENSTCHGKENEHRAGQRRKQHNCLQVYSELQETRRDLGVAQDIEATQTDLEASWRVFDTELEAVEERTTRGGGASMGSSACRGGGPPELD
jgi:hypothetical protein